MQEDHAWLEQLRSGDPEGLRCIYGSYRDDLLSVATGLLVDRASAEDCVHDVFVAVAGTSNLQLHGTLRGYLVTCVSVRLVEGDPARWQIVGGI